MPLFESLCSNPDCPLKGRRQEHYYKSSEAKAAPCNSCGGETVIVLSSYNVVFTGPLTARYNDPRADKPNAEGHWVLRKKSSVTGKPYMDFISTFQEQKEYARAEGLANPSEMPSKMEVGDDGKTVSFSGTEI